MHTAFIRTTGSLFSDSVTCPMGKRHLRVHRLWPGRQICENALLMGSKKTWAVVGGWAGGGQAGFHRPPLSSWTRSPWEMQTAHPSQRCLCASQVASVVSLCNPMDCSPPGSSVHGILQARILEWVAMPSCRGSSLPRDWTHVSYVSCIGRWVLCHQRHLGSPHHSGPSLIRSSSIIYSIRGFIGVSLAVQWLRICASTAGGTGSFPGWEAKILHATLPKTQKQKGSTNSRVTIAFFCLRTFLFKEVVLETEAREGRGKNKIYL